MTALLDAPVRNWACPACQEKTKTNDAGTPLHNCAGLNGLHAPFVEVHDIDDRPDARHLVLGREDYVGDSGASHIMAVHTDHGDGSNDRTVFAPTADLDLKGLPHDVTVVAGLAAAHAKMHHKGFSNEENARMARMAHIANATMAFGSSSKIFAHTMLDTMTRATAVDWNSDTILCALYGNSGTPDNTVTTDVLTYWHGSGSQWVTGNELASSGGYTQGGVSVSSPTVTQSSNVVTFTSSGSPQWTSATFNAYGDLIYDTTVSVGLCFNSFGGEQSVSGGSFTITWSGSGIAAISL